MLSVIGRSAKDYACLSTDTKPVGVSNGSMLVEMDTGITSIQSNAFNYANALDTIIVRNTTPPFISAKINSTAKIYVPDESVDAYKTTGNWSSKASQIYPLSECQG